MWVGKKFLGLTAGAIHFTKAAPVHLSFNILGNLFFFFEAKIFLLLARAGRAE